MSCNTGFTNYTCLGSWNEPNTIAYDYLHDAIDNRNPTRKGSRHLLKTVSQRIISAVQIPALLVVSIVENIFYALASLYTYCFDPVETKKIMKAFNDSLYVSAWCLVAFVKNIYEEEMTTYRSQFLNETCLIRLIQS